MSRMLELVGHMLALFRARYFLIPVLVLFTSSCRPSLSPEPETKRVGGRFVTPLEGGRVVTPLEFSYSDTLIFDSMLKPINNTGKVRMRVNNQYPPVDWRRDMVVKIKEEMTVALNKWIVPLRGYNGWKQDKVTVVFTNCQICDVDMTINLDPRITRASAGPRQMYIGIDVWKLDAQGVPLRTLESATQFVLVHELGHNLGLGDTYGPYSAGQPTSIMNGHGNTMAVPTLRADDIAGIKVVWDRIMGKEDDGFCGKGYKPYGKSNRGDQMCIPNGCETTSLCRTCFSVNTDDFYCTKQKVCIKGRTNRKIDVFKFRNATDAELNECAKTGKRDIYSRDQWERSFAANTEIKLVDANIVPVCKQTSFCRSCISVNTDDVYCTDQKVCIKGRTNRKIKSFKFRKKTGDNTFIDKKCKGRNTIYTRGEWETAFKRKAKLGIERQVGCQDRKLCRRCFTQGAYTYCTDQKVCIKGRTNRKIKSFNFKFEGDDPSTLDAACYQKGRDNVVERDKWEESFNVASSIGVPRATGCSTSACRKCFSSNGQAYCTTQQVCIKNKTNPEIKPFIFALSNQSDIDTYCTEKGKDLFSRQEWERSFDADTQIGVSRQ